MARIPLVGRGSSGQISQRICSRYLLVDPKGNPETDILLQQGRLEL
ncbi:hypothetical protein Hdeb2414_s0005g00153551 [Helianthus debilis subsp. tardiflorus]